MKLTCMCDVMPCNLVDRFQRLGAEPAFEGGKWGDRLRPRSYRWPRTGKNFMSNEKN